MHRSLRLLPLLFVLTLAASAQEAEPVDEPVDEAAIEVLRRHGLEESQVMDHLAWLTDVHGPRLTGSPGLEEASRWAIERLEGWGLQNAQLEPWGPFGNGWTLERFSLHVTGENPFPVHAYPKAWSPSTDGPVTAEVVLFDAETDEDFAAAQGTLKGAFVFLEEVRELEEPFEAPAQRRDAENLLELATAGAADVREYTYSAEAMARLRLQQRRMQFLYEEEPAAIFNVFRKGDYGTIFVSGASLPQEPGSSWMDRKPVWGADPADIIPQITIAAEHYNRIARLTERGLPVAMELDLRSTFHTDDPMEYNVTAEIPGTDPEIGDEVVIIGAHLDSWHAGTGATDNGAGSAVMMEAMRLLTKVYEETGTEPRRTIRIALWTGEEQGLYGSRAYVNQRYAEIEGWGSPPTRLKPEHETFSAYYNMDNGTGKIRGVYLQGNEAVRLIFRAWLAPFADLGAATLTYSNTGGTDHLAFDAAGLPGFQFIQDPIAYSTQTHHSNMDVYDHAIADDLKQAATIIAAFAYHTAQRDEKLPRKPLPVPEPEEAQVGSN